MEMTTSETNQIFNLTSLDDAQEKQTTRVKLLSDEVTDLVEYITTILMLFTNIIAVATNSINIRVFLKQRYRTESMTLTLLCLSILDIIGSLFLIPISICFLIKTLYTKAPIYITCNTFTLLTTSAIHEMCSYAAGWVTVFMSIERSLCVLMPIKVKLLITPKISLIVILAICTAFATTNTTIMCHLKIAWKKHPVLDYSYALPYKSPLATKLLFGTNFTLTTVLNSTAIIIVFVATALMVYKLYKTRKWRMTSARSQQNVKAPKIKNKNGRNENIRQFEDLKSISRQDSTIDQQSGTATKSQNPSATSSKDIEAMKTVCIVTSIFLVCISTGHIPAAVILSEPSISFGGPNRNLITMVSTVKYYFASVNACVNFFFFLRFSSRYQAVFYSMYPRFAK